MPRTASDPSGAARPVTINLSPASIELLDHHANIRGLSRSALIANVLARLNEPGGTPKVAATTPKPEHTPGPRPFVSTTKDETIHPILKKTAKPKEETS